jgi:demethylmenaquinone methyltransferase/2-methoxy-6-polyprenyl-1,4-benzoquinol methylase
MAGPFYDPGEHRAEKVSDLFSTVAPRYDLINDVQSLGLHRRWKRRVLGAACVHPGDRALDVCCGTGDIAFLLARAGARVVGLDFSQAMLAIAERRRVHAADRDNPRFVLGDALALPFSDNSFDIVTIGYGLRNLACWQTGLREMRRVARPGARLVVLDFGKPDHRLWRFLYYAYLRVMVPGIGLALCGNAGAYAYIFESLRDYPAQGTLAHEARDLGLTEVRTIDLLAGAMSITMAVK